MSKIKDLKTDPENSINLVEILSLVCPTGKSKYVDAILRIVKSTTGLDEAAAENRESLISDYGMNKADLAEFDSLQIIHMKKFLDDVFELTDIKAFQKFCAYNERNLIKNNDLSRYSKFAEVHAAVGAADLKLTEKQMESQIVKLYEDAEWLVLKPLTFEASKKYGANTKWCTTTENNSDHFNRYGKGILTYCLNKKTNHKIASYKALEGNEFSFWSPTDEKIDSLDSGLPFEILKIISDEAKNCKTGNLSIKK